jgi:hypothetical protein
MAEAEDYLRYVKIPITGQQYIAGPHGAGFLLSLPDRMFGKIFAIPIFPVIVGVGRKTVEQLIRMTRALLSGRDVSAKICASANAPREGSVALVEAGHAQGCIFAMECILEPSSKRNRCVMTTGLLHWRSHVRLAQSKSSGGRGSKFSS